jgi:hypothetical protein
MTERTTSITKKGETRSDRPPRGVSWVMVIDQKIVLIYEFYHILTFRGISYIPGILSKNIGFIDSLFSTLK